jgi:hypothetical protein
VSLLLDVDGVINVLGDDELAPYRHVMATNHDNRTFTLRIGHECSEWLALLAERFEIVWATSWRNANEAISPLVGLPTDLRQVWFPRGWNDVPLDLCAKTPWVRRFATDNGITTLAWIDDSAGHADADALVRDWSGVTATRPWQEVVTVTPPLDAAFVVTTDPSTGLTRTHVDTLLDWQAGIIGRPS